MARTCSANAATVAADSTGVPTHGLYIRGKDHNLQYYSLVVSTSKKATCLATFCIFLQLVSLAKFENF